MTEAVQDGVRINRTDLRLTKSDITDLDIEAFVFYAQPDLILGSGFGNAISVRGGPSVQKELDDLGAAPVATGDAVISGTGNLKARHIIHAVGPRFQEENIEGKLRTTILNTLTLAEEKGIKRLAFPAMGAGYYGIPVDLCARVMLETIKSHLVGETGLEEIVICVLDTPQFEGFKAPLGTLA